MDGGGHEKLLDGLRQIVCEVVEMNGLELVDLHVRGSSKRRQVRIDVDRAGPAGIKLEDCQTVTRALDTCLEDAGLLSGSYVLEVSSPGIDRPIVTADDLRRNTGRFVRVETREAIGGVSSFSGVLRAVDDEAIHLSRQDADDVSIPRAWVGHMQQDVDF